MNESTVFGVVRDSTQDTDVIERGLTEMLAAVPGCKIGGAGKETNELTAKFHSDHT